MNHEDFSRGANSGGDGDLDEALDTLTFEVALLFFRMRTAATQYLGRGEHSSGHRSILKSLDAHGPQTVPEMARLRSVSRQHVQKLVDGLKADGLVEATPNPAHRRSVLIALTPEGVEFVNDLAKREKALWRFLGRDLSAAGVKDATEVVRTLRHRFESEEWAQEACSESAPP